MVDSDGDATIFHIDSDILRFEKETLQLNGYEAARLPIGIDKIVIEKKGNRLEILADSKPLLSWSQSASGQTRLQVSADYSLVGQGAFAAKLEAQLVDLEDNSDLPKLINIDDSAVKLYRVSADSYSSEESFLDFFKEKGVDFFVEKLRGQWGIVFAKELPIQLARIPAVDWETVAPSQVADYLSDSDFALDGHDSGPFKGLYLPFSKGGSVYLAFRTFAGTEGVMAVTESAEVEGLKFRLRYSPTDKSVSESEDGGFGKLLRDLVAENRTQPIAPNQKLVEERLFAVIGQGMEEMIEQQLMIHGGSGEAMRQLRSQFKEEVRKNFALEWGRIQSEFLPTEEEAANLLKGGPNREKNSEAIEANWKKLEQSNAAIPFIAASLYQKFSKGSEKDPWFSEAVKRVTEVMLREVEENSEQTQSQPLRFVPEKGDQNRSSWTVLPKGSALHLEGWAVMARLVINGEARPTLPGEKEPFLLLRLLDGNEDWIKLEIRDLVEDRKLTMSLKLGEPGSIFVNGRGYRVLFPRQDIANDKKGTTPFATVLITEENAMDEKREEVFLKPEDLEGNLAQLYGSDGSVSVSLEEAIITQASKARQSYASLSDPQSKEIPKEYWGEAIARLKPIRVMVDRSNVFIVLKEKEGTAHGLYVYNSSSSYFPTLDEPCFLELRKMSSSEALWGSIFQCTMKTSVDE